MSNPVSENRASASEIHAAASDWVVERNTNDAWGADEQTELDAWLAQSIAHRVAYVRFEDAWARSRRLAALGRSSRTQAVLETLRNLRPLVFRVAAAFVYAAIMGGVIYYFLRPTSNAQTFATPLGGHETVILADGSQIELNTDTVLRISETQNERDVALEKGEAFFRVKHNPNRLFVVTAGTRRIVDIGTQFVVRNEADKLKVTLLEGSVSFDSGAQKATLTSGDVLVATAGSVSLIRKSPQRLSDELAWRQGLVVLQHTTLAAAAAEFNRYNREKIVIADPAVGELAISGTLPANNPDEFARVAQSFFRLRVGHQGGAIVISR
ncbi:MAG TPA: FecR domain-containing protein [Rhizomicrobium sp.]|nr:FecR domain-containing protein [Rhizomicrobium sp.]